MPGIDLGGCKCDSCPLLSTKRGNYVGAEGVSTLSPRFPKLMLVGEAPGQEEARSGIPFFGQSGQELDNYLRRVGIPRGNWWITNLVKCRPPKNRDPERVEIECCSPCLEREIGLHQPGVIATVGKYAARYFLGQDVDMEMVHGIPFLLDSGRVVVPCYHPAFGLYSTTNMTQIHKDFQAVAQVVRGEIRPRVVGEDRGSRYTYTLLDNPKDIRVLMAFSRRELAIDTESLLPNGFTVGGSTPWCLTFTTGEDRESGWMIRADNEECLQEFRPWVQSEKITTILHNALWDLPVLAQMGVYPKRYHDTMVAAYLLQDYPKGLKALGYRLLGVNMTAYERVIMDAQQSLSLQYLYEVSQRAWPDPAPRLEWVKGIPKEKHPQNIGKKIKRIFTDLIKNPDLDLVKRWGDIEDKLEVEGVLGHMPVASLADIPFDHALEYACRDAVVTMGIYPALMEQIRDRGLTETYNRDIGIIPMIIDIMRNGMKIDPEYLQGLSQYFERRMEDVQMEVETMFYAHTHEEKHINPGSTEQSAEALWKMGIFKTKKQSTAAEELDKVKHKHPIVGKITEYRQFSKLKGTYSDTLPGRIGVDGRLHCRIATTRTTTGRLATSDPNLQNIPTGTEEGQKIRGGFVAEEGYTYLCNDYSQIELRVMCHEARDKVMTQAFLSGADLHSSTASNMFRIPLAEAHKEHPLRRAAKGINFGIPYGITEIGLHAQMLAQGVDCTEAECKEWIYLWLNTYSGVRDYLKGVKEFAKCNGYVADLFGRRRLVPEVMSIHPRIREAGLRQAMNAPIQSGAQGVIKEAMVLLTPMVQEWVRSGWMLGPVMQIHDDLMFEVKEEFVGEVAPVIKAVMEGAVLLSIPTPVDQKVGKVWAKTEKLKG